MKGFERRQIKESFTLPLLHLTFSIFSSVCLTFALCLVLCCAGTTSVFSFDNFVFIVTVLGNLRYGTSEIPV